MRASTDRQPDPGWDDLGRILAEDSLVLPASRRSRWHEEWGEVVALERDLDDRLAVGLVGGTGVGKSTLINALAGRPISSTSDRRPTTDRVIVYRHARTLLPETLPRTDLGSPEVEHQETSLERIIVLDFPDFDSVDELHREILARYLPHVDVLLVLVDDMKYGDSRLYELLRAVSQSPENLYLLLNKRDRLEFRYSGETEEVVGSILDDLREKLAHHAGIHLSEGHFLSISALRAFEIRSQDGSRKDAGTTPSDRARDGHFSDVLDLLARYRGEKRRRAAKELNLEARKEALRAAIREDVLRPELKTQVERARGLLDGRVTELGRILEGTTPSVLSPVERRRLVADVSRRANASLGFPLDSLVTVARHLRRRAPAASVGRPSDLTASRVVSHYRAYVDGVHNALAASSLEVGDLLPARWTRAVEPRGSVEIADVVSASPLEPRLGAVGQRLGRRSVIRNHVVAGIVVLLFLWWIFFPSVRLGVLGIAGEESVTWSEVLGTLLRSFLEALNPVVLVGVGVLVLVAYALTAVALWAERAQLVERAIAEAEHEVRGRVADWGGNRIAASRDVLRRWLVERAELEARLGPPSAESD